MGICKLSWFWHIACSKKNSLYFVSIQFYWCTITRDFLFLNRYFWAATLLRHVSGIMSLIVPDYSTVHSFHLRLRKYNNSVHHLSLTLRDYFSHKFNPFKACILPSSKCGFSKSCILFIAVKVANCCLVQ